MEKGTVINFDDAARELLELKFDEEVEARIMKFKPDSDENNDVRFVPNYRMLEIVESYGVEDFRKNEILHKLYPHFKKLFEDMR